MLPLEHGRPKAIVREPCHGVQQRILCELQVHKDIAWRIGAVAVGMPDLVRMMERCPIIPSSVRQPARAKLFVQSPETRLDAPVVDIVRYAQCAIEITFPLDALVCFVNREEKVREDDGGIDASAVLHPRRTARCGLRIAGAHRDAIVDILRESAGELRLSAWETL